MSRTIRQRGLPGAPTQTPQAWEAEHAAAARWAAAEGMVLLQNKGGLLPVAPGTPLALYGSGAGHTVKGGTGSGDVNERYSVSIWEGLRNAGYPVTDEDWLQAYEIQYERARADWRAEVLRRNANGTGGLDFFMAYASTPFSIPAGPAVSKTSAEIAVYVLSRIAGEGRDRTLDGGDYCLSGEEHQMLADICRLYPSVAVVLNAGGVVDLHFLDEFPNIRAVLSIVQPGMEGGNAFADVFSGKVTPSGKLTDTWAYRYEDYPNAATYSYRNGNTQEEKYEEGIYVGYRYFDSFDIPVRYSFGYGLSYTRFNLETIGLRADRHGKVSVSVRVTNAGDTWSGREVVQVYVSLPEGALEKEYRRLCAFAKTRSLAPGESQIMELSFTPEEAASYDAAAAQWVLESGVYGVFVGSALGDSRLIGALHLAQKKVLAQAKNICPLQTELDQLSIPVERRKAREHQVVEHSKAMHTAVWDLSGLETQVYNYDAPDNPDDEAARIAEQLTLEQRIAMSTGDPAKGQGSALGSAGVSVPGSAGETSTCALDRGVANIVLADGPAGLRLNQVYLVQDGKPQMLPMEASLEHGLFFQDTLPEGERRWQYCTALPVGTLLAQTWDPPLLEEIGSLVGEEMERYGVTLWLAPGMNIHRNPLCGRNFEYYAEDPLLSGKMAAAVTRGVQSHPGCGTTIKHFACNNQEDNRMASDSILSERALREIYLRGFGIAIREAQPMSMMTSYNLVNGVHAANSYDLCTAVARHEFAFDGFLMTDWTTTEHGPDCTAARCIWAGNDLIMPGQFSDQDSIREALAAGDLWMEELKTTVARIIRVILRSNCYE